MGYKRVGDKFVWDDNENFDSFMSKNGAGGVRGNALNLSSLNNARASAGMAAPASNALSAFAGMNPMGANSGGVGSSIGSAAGAGLGSLFGPGGTVIGGMIGGVGGSIVDAIGSGMGADDEEKKYQEEKAYRASRDAQNDRFRRIDQKQANRGQNQTGLDYIDRMLRNATLKAAGAY